MGQGYVSARTAAGMRRPAGFARGRPRYAPGLEPMTVMAAVFLMGAGAGRVYEVRIDAHP